QDGKSRMTGDCHVRICGSPGVRFPRATRPRCTAAPGGLSADGTRIAAGTRARCGDAEGDGGWGVRDEDIAAVRDRSPIDEVVGEYLQLKNAGGGSLKGLCPFHEEKTPSFNVTP